MDKPKTSKVDAHFHMADKIPLFEFAKPKEEANNGQNLTAPDAPNEPPDTPQPPTLPQFDVPPLSPPTPGVQTEPLKRLSLATVGDLTMVRDPKQAYLIYQ